MKSLKRLLRLRKLDIRDVVKVLKEDLNYMDSELDINYDESTVVVSHRIVIVYEPKGHLFFIAFVSGTEALGASTIIHALHKNGISNIQFKENFFIIEDKTQPDGFMSFYGEDADRAWEKVFRAGVVQKLKQDFVSAKIMKNGAGETFH